MKKTIVKNRIAILLLQIVISVILMKFSYEIGDIIRMHIEKIK